MRRFGIAMQEADPVGNAASSTYSAVICGRFNNELHLRMLMTGFAGRLGQSLLDRWS